MYEREKYLSTIEFGEVLKLLADEAGLAPAKEKALNLTPAESFEKAVFSLKQTEDAYLLTAKFASPSFGSPKDPTGLLARCEMGGTLGISELLDVADALRTIRVVKEWRSDISAEIETSLDELFSCLFPNKYIEDKIRFAIKNSEELSDSASPKLSDIRRKMRGVSASIKDKLDSIVKSHSRAKYLQETIVTQRDGRFVVPVKSEFKSEIPGIVHDTSSSGATLFIEPMSVVEANNELRVLEASEREEIERILAELSNEVSTFATAIKDSFKCVVELNLVFAKASLAYKMRATVPAFNRDGRLLLKNARHPLIDGKKVVPISLSLGDEYDSLIITGPNTGGKTVTLKTVGLLTVMTMCGMMIPADDGSRISFFDRILVDIGDEQSIEQSLSTFSAHMTNIIRILNIADDKSLILIDELGAGTDPVEGAALAISIIEAMRAKGTRVMATTHYAELKAYAIQTVGVENACCEFDVATLRPTYRLLIGVPGRSNAFAISARLGMPANIVEHAKKLVSDESTMFEEVVSRLEESRRKMEDERESAEQLRLKAQNMEKEAEALRDRAEKDAKHEIERARMEAAELVQKTRREAQSLLDELEDLRRNKQKLLTAEQKARLKAGIRDMEKASDPVHERRIDEDYVLPRPLQVGDTVLIYDIDKIATVLDVPKNGDQILVQAGIIKTRVPLKNLRLTDQKPKEKKKAAGGHRTVTKKMDSAPARNEVDVRGMNLEEALMEVDAFIDHALMHNLNMLTIIHGKGTGILRNGIQQHLRRHKAVKSFRLGVYGEGESGVTIVELK